MSDKKIIQRNLPLTESYNIIGFSYVPIMDGQGTCCDNCGKIISNMVKIQDSTGKKFTIGQDCAETLTVALKNSSELFFNVNPAFNEGKQTRAKLLKGLKTGNIISYHLYTSTDKKIFIVGNINRGGSTMFQILYPDITLNYIKDLLTEKKIINHS